MLLRSALGRAVAPSFLLAALAVAAGCSTMADDSASAADALTIDQLPIAVTAATAGTFQQTIDHSPDAGTKGSATFSQRYWYTTEFASGPNSPVLYYFCGEQVCGPWALERMADTAKSLHAVVVALEHRYYGESNPFALVTLERLKFLSMHQALEDAVTFQAFAKQTLGFGGKWITVGGSYSGMLAAFYREKHPDLVVGAWASSAPVNMQKSFYGYDAISARALGPVCLTLFQQALGTADRAYDVPERRKELSLALFGVEWKEEWGKASFLDSISGAAMSAAQLGDTHRLCPALQQHSDNPIDGVVAYYNPPLVPDDSVANGPGPGVPRVDPTLAVPSDAIGPGNTRRPRPADAEQSFEGVEWFYQVCTEVGFYQVPNPDRTQSIMSSMSASEAAQDEMCQRFMHSTPDVAKARAEYYDPIVAGQVSNVFWVNGSLDPWSALSFLDPRNPPGDSTVFVIQQGSHHDELTNLKKDSPIAVFEAHVLFNKLAKRWLAD